MSMIFTGVAAAMLAAPAPNAATPPPPVRTEQPAKSEAKDGKNELFDMFKLFAIFDKMFPAQPDPAPERLALARTSVQGLLPDGTYGRMMGDMMDGIVGRVLDMSEADFGAKGKKGEPPSKETLRQVMMKEDPHFEERMRITQRVVGEEMAKIAVLIEPKIREGLARSMARRFDAKQLADLNAFLATESGRAFGRQSMSMWVDSDVMRSVFTSFPEIVMTVPGAMKRVEEATAHLPKPKKAEKEEPKQEDQPEADEAEEEEEEPAAE